MAPEVYPYYVKVRDDCDDMVEIPTKSDGTMMLSSVKSQFPEAVGLRFKSAAGLWRGVRITGNILDPPLEGWGDDEYSIVLPKNNKRYHHDFTGPAAKLAKMSKDEILSDMIVLGLPNETTDEDLEKHFSRFGKLEACEIKYDRYKKSRGFAFLRFKTIESVAAALKGTHILHKRRVELRFPKQGKDNIATKLFVGKLPKETSKDDLRDHFSEYGVLKDVYIPQPFRSYGFVTYGSQLEANNVLKAEHVLKGIVINVALPTDKNNQKNNEEKNNGGAGSTFQGYSGNKSGPGGNMGYGGFMGHSGGNMIGPGGYMDNFGRPGGIMGGSDGNMNALGGIVSGTGVGFPGGNVSVNSNVGMNMGGFNGHMGGLNNIPYNANVGPGGNSKVSSHGFSGGYGSNACINTTQQNYFQANKPSSGNYVWNGRKS